MTELDELKAKWEAHNQELGENPAAEPRAVDRGKAYASGIPAAAAGDLRGTGGGDLARDRRRARKLYR